MPLRVVLADNSYREHRADVKKVALYGVQYVCNDKVKLQPCALHHLDFLSVFGI
jgi:hypothetical protein